MCTLKNKKSYVVHYRTLQLYIQLGLKLTKIHRVISFTQDKWMRKYIKFNIRERKSEKNDFEKDFFKLANNAVFGKTMENVKNHMDLKLITDNNKAINYF